MRKLLPILILLLAGTTVVAQQITSMEYFIDADPGPGNGIALSITPGASINLTDLISVQSVPLGFHSVSLRAKADIGYWSNTIKRNFFVEAAQAGGQPTFHEIVSAEFFFDADPGPGNATPLQLDAATSVVLNDSVIAGLAPGVHKIALRTLSSSGIWSNTVSRLLSITTSNGNSNAAIIESAEYFFDSDPGPGNGIPIALNPSDSLTIDGDIALDTLNFGSHILYLRFKSGFGIWSNPASANFTFCSSNPPQAQFTYTVNGFEVFYTNTSGYSGSDISWNLQGQSISGTDAPSQILPGTGTFPACMSINSVCGTDSNCEAIVIADTIQIVSVNPDQVQSGEITDVTFETHYTTFDATNVFTLLLSDAQGNFNNPLTLAQLESDTAGVFENVLIPMNLQAGCYALKVVSSSPAHESPEDTQLKVYSPTFEPGNYAVSLDGIDDVVDAGPLLGDHDFTVSFWVKPDGSVSQTGAIIDMQNDLAIYENPDLADNYVLLHLLQFDLLPNDWNHITVTMDAATDTRRVYLFGQLIDENQWTYAPANDYHMLLGATTCSYCGGNFKGLIDEFKCWNTRLNQQEIFHQMNYAPVENDPNLIAYYTFDEGCFSEVLDNSLFGNDAGLLNGAQAVPSDLIQGSTSVYPSRGGNNGWITLHIEGAYFPDSVYVLLSNTELGQITSDTAIVTLDHQLTVAYLNLTDQPLGLYDVIVMDYNGNAYVYPESFTIEAADTTGGLEVQILGQNTIREGSRHVFFVVYENTTNVNMRRELRNLTCNSTDWMGFSDEQLLYQYRNLPIILSDRMVDQTGVTYNDSWLSPGVQYVIPVYAISHADSSREVSCAELSPFILEGAYPVRTEDEGFEDELGPNPFTGHNYVDGCSAPPGLVPLGNQFLFRGNVFVDWNALFLPACTNHDYCYQQCYRPGTWERAQEICDLNMYEGMCRICQEQYGDWDDGDPLPAGFIPTWYDADGYPHYPPKPLNACREAAAAFYSMLRFAGDRVGFNPDQALCTGILDRPAPQDMGDSFQVLDCHCPNDAICFKPRRINSYDPNIKIGPSIYQNTNMDWAYAIYFENAATATAPAQSVTIIDTLDVTRYDLSSFAFTGFGFGQTLRMFSTTTENAIAETVDMPTNDSTLVSVSGYMDVSTGIAQWQFTAIDSISQEPLTGVFDGFLPPNDSIGSGQGFVLFTINPLEGLVTGDSVLNHASIYFDYNNPIITEDWVNLLDFSPPSSYIGALEPFATDTLITLELWGEDSILSQEYSLSIYVSDNGQEYYLWHTNVTDSTILFTGIAGHSYSFYSVATDAAGNEEQAPIVPDATTLLYMPGLPITISADITAPSCINQHDGSINIHVNGTSPIYHFIWDGVASTDSLTDLPEGSYHLVIADYFDIVVLDTNLSVSDPEPITVELLTTAALCFGEASGMAEVTASGGTGDIAVDWMGANPLALMPGNYSITIYDENQCSVDTAFVITSPEAISVQLMNLTPSSATCDGTITIEASGGVPPYAIVWSDDQNQTGTTAVNLCEGTYTAEVSDANGCLETATFDLALGMQETQSIESSIALWPNPVTDHCILSINHPRADRMTIKIFNEIGQHVIAPITIQTANGQTNMPLDLARLSNGAYWIHVISSSSVYIQQFLISNH